MATADKLAGSQDQHLFQQMIPLQLAVDVLVRRRAETGIASFLFSSREKLMPLQAVTFPGLNLWWHLCRQGHVKKHGGNVQLTAKYLRQLMQLIFTETAKHDDQFIVNF